MAGLGRRWAGRIFGTNTGNVSVILESNDDQVAGELRLVDDQFGPCRFSLKGTFDGSKVRLVGQPEQAPEGIELGELTIDGDLLPEGNIKGEWSSALGTGGIFELYPHDAPSRIAGAVGGIEQVNEEMRLVGSIRLYGDEINTVIEELLSDFVSPPRAVVTYRNDAGVRTIYLPDFLIEAPNLGRISYLKIFAQEPELNGINKLVVLELGVDVQNSIRAQSAKPTWVLGKAEGVARRLAPYEEKLATGYRKFGLNALQLLFFGGLLVALPSVSSIWLRVLLLLVVGALLWAFNQAHRHFFRNFSFQPAARKPNQLVRSLPKLLSWLSAILASVLAAYAAYILGVA